MDEMAAARGQRVELVPPREMVALAENAFLARNIMFEDLKKKFPNLTQRQIKSTIAEIMRKGTAAQGNPAVLAYLEKDAINLLYKDAQEVARQEEKNGSIIAQLEQKAKELKSKGDRVDSFVISSHSDGSNLTGETANRLSANDLYHLKQEQPQLFDSARHVLLLGCYNLTKPNHKAWRHDLFPFASMLAGFGIRAPSRFDETSANFIRQMMSTAEKLDRQLIPAKNNLDPALVSSTFLGLNSFTTKDHPGLADYCGEIVEGQPGTWTHDCDEQWSDLYKKIDKMRPYWSLRNPREDPLDGGQMRNFYNTLQLACPAQEAKSERNDWKASERMRITFRENAIRLLYWWNIQSNFATYFEKEINLMNRLLAKYGVENTMPLLDGNASRVSFVNAYHSIREKLNNQPNPQKYFEDLYYPLLLLKGENTVAEGEKLTVAETLKRNAIPFNWIEGTTVMGKR